MARRKLQVQEEYRFGPRSVLKRGDRFRVSGGPVYVTEDGAKVPMRERGIFVFRRYCQRGSAEWLEAYHANGGGLAILWVGKAHRSPLIPNLRRRPYRVTRKLRNGQAKATK
jgi:hypothetical protein